MSPDEFRKEAMELIASFCKSEPKEGFELSYLTKASELRSIYGIADMTIEEEMIPNDELEEFLKKKLEEMKAQF